MTDTAATTRPVPELLREESRRLVGFLTLLTGDRRQADDLFQDTCVEALRHQDRFQPGTDFGAWVRTIARYQVLRHWRASRRNRFVPFSADMMERLSVVWAEEPDAGPEDARRSALQACLGQLGSRHREVLAWRYERRWKQPRIAEEIGRSVEAVKMLLSRLRKKLRLCVELRLNEDEIERVERRSR